MRHLIIVATALTMAGAAYADVGAPVKIERAQGVVSAFSEGEITLSEAGGKTETIKLLPTWSVSVSKTISVDQIQPGSYLGTTNHPTSSAAGVSTEVHVSPPGVVGPGVDFVMDAAANTTMTNGVVATVVKTDGGRELTVNYGPGVRKVTVPPGVPIVLNSPGDRSLVRVGRTVRVTIYTPADGRPRQIVTVGENGNAPPM